MAKLKYFETTVTTQNFIQDEIKERLNSEILDTIQFRIFLSSACYLKTQRLKFFQNFYLVVVLSGVKLDLSHKRRP
jgi:hypothetical protein